MLYRLQNRDNRLFPKKWNRSYYVLTSLRNVLQRIISHPDFTFDSLLDFGCGNKPYKPLFQNKCHTYVGADIEGNPDADLIIENGRLPVENDSFDCVLSTQVLEYVEDPVLYLNEACSVLKSDGTLILSTHGFWQYHPDPTDYWRWTIDVLKKLLRTQDL